VLGDVISAKIRDTVLQGSPAVALAIMAWHGPSGPDAKASQARRLVPDPQQARRSRLQGSGEVEI
jgi:hypothetical protein